MKPPKNRILFIVLLCLILSVMGKISARELVPGDKYLIRVYLPFLYHTRTPEAATQSFVEELFTGETENLALYLCASAQEVAPGMKEGLESMRETIESSGATLDVSGFTYKLLNQDGSTATVEVAGKLTVTVAGSSVDSDFPAIPIPLVRENGSWKLCE